MDDKEADPLDIRKLSLTYDYLLYKIQDRISSLAERTYEAVSIKKQYIYEEHLDRRLEFSKKIEQIDSILKDCNSIEQEFLKIEQLEGFVEEFKKRLDNLEREYREL